jgi:hypothetical protein
MARIFAVGLLLISFASVAVADGPDIPPAGATSQAKIGIVKLADGPDIPPAQSAGDATIHVVRLADGPDIPPMR